MNEADLPKHLTKFLDKDGNPNPEAAARIEAGRKKRAADAAKAKIKDVTPPGYGPKEEVEMAIMSLDHKEPARKLKITQKGLDALRAARDKPKVKTQVKITKKGREAIKDEVELDELSPELAKRAYQGARKKRQQIFNKSDETDRIPNVKKQDRQAKKFTAYAAKKEDVEDAYDYKAKKGAIAAPGSGSIAKAKKAKASDVTKSIEQQMADARKESVEFQEGEWDQMWKNAAHSKPKMSFKQATEFVNEVGLDKKEKTNALKTAKKWLK